MTIKHICRNCKHWGVTHGIFSLEKLTSPRPHGYGFTREDAIKYIVEDRAKDDNRWGCEVIANTVEVEIDQGHGWDAGGASVEEICVPGDFGCNKFEPVEFIA